MMPLLTGLGSEVRTSDRTSSIPAIFFGVALRDHDLQLVVHVDRVLAHEAGRLELPQMPEIDRGIDVGRAAIFLAIVNPAAALDR